MAKFLPSVIAVLDNYITVGVAPDIHVLTVEVKQNKFFPPRFLH